MALNTLRDLYVEQLRDLYSAENQILKSLPKMAEAAKHPELRQAFESHVTLTEEHVRRLEQIFTDLGEKGSGTTARGWRGSSRKPTTPSRRRATPTCWTPP
jgi:ferritin-like metal-binding protein YciE